MELVLTESEVKKMTKKKFALIGVMAICAICMFSFTSMGLASMLGISSVAAGKVITIIDSVSTVALIISLVATIIGAGAISTAIVATAKKMISKYGKKYATMW